MSSFMQISDDESAPAAGPLAPPDEGKPAYRHNSIMTAAIRPSRSDNQSRFSLGLSI